MTSRARVLFVDDEQRVLNSMRAMFRREFDLFLTTDGAAAVSIAADNPIDVIIADQRMPGMSGIEVLEEIKILSPKTIRILLTGYADPAAVEGSINIGEVFRFLSKPCPPKVLRETLQLAVRATRAVQDERTPRLSLDANITPATEIKIEEPRPLFADTELPVLQPIPNSYPREEVSSIEKDASEVGVVLYTMDSTFAEAALRTISNERHTTLATSLIRAMQALEEKSSGVLITDITTEFARLQRIIGALKRQLPELVTVVVSDSRDSNNMINLINYGQVFRYEQKPIAPHQLREDINAAAVKHVNLRIKPYLAKRHAVADLPTETFAPPMYQRDLGAIMGLRQQRTRAFGGQL